MCKSGVASTKTLVEVTAVGLALVALLLRLRLSYGFYYKPLLLRFCGIAVLNSPPERLPFDLTPLSPVGQAVINLKMCVCHMPLQRDVPLPVSLSLP